MEFAIRVPLTVVYRLAAQGASSNSSRVTGSVAELTGSTPSGLVQSRVTLSRRDVVGLMSGMPRVRETYDQDGAAMP